MCGLGCFKLNVKRKVATDVKRLCLTFNEKKNKAEEVFKSEKICSNADH